MGKAKQRGTYEQRVAMAEERNDYLKAQLPEHPNAALRKLESRHGIQRLATILTAAGMIPVPKPNKP